MGSRWWHYYYNYYLYQYNVIDGPPVTGSGTGTKCGTVITELASGVVVVYQLYGSHY